MKKILLFLSIILILTSCATTEETKIKDPIVIGEDGAVMPEWINVKPKSDDLYYEVGYGMMSNKMNSLKKAKSAATDLIAQWVNTNVKEVILNYTNDSGEGENRQAIDAMEIISLQVAEATLSGISQEEIWTDKDGGVYMLVSIPYANVQKGFEPASEVISKTFEKNEAAEVANEKMKSAFEELLKGSL